MIGWKSGEKKRTSERLGAALPSAYAVGLLGSYWKLAGDTEVVETIGRCPPDDTSFVDVNSAVQAQVTRIRADISQTEEDLAALDKEGIHVHPLPDLLLMPKPIRRGHRIWEVNFSSPITNDITMSEMRIVDIIPVDHRFDIEENEQGAEFGFTYSASGPSAKTPIVFHHDDVDGIEIKSRSFDPSRRYFLSLTSAKLACSYLTDRFSELARQTERLSRTKRTLFRCRSATEACLGAAGQDVCGLAVVLICQRGCYLSVAWGESTVFGPVHRRVEDPDQQLIEALVFETLATDTKDVWLYCNEGRAVEFLVDKAMAKGYAADRAGPVDEEVENPFSVFSERHLQVQASDSGEAKSFCVLNPADHPPMEPGALLSMDAIPGMNTSEILYRDSMGNRVGLHGILPWVVSDDLVRRLAEVRAEITSVSWGRFWQSNEIVDCQLLIFSIPDDVAEALQAATLPVQYSVDGSKP